MASALEDISATIADDVVEVPPAAEESTKEVALPSQAAATDAGHPAHPSIHSRAKETANFLQRPAALDKHRSVHVDVKGVIAFSSLKMKEHYSSHLRLMYFEERDLVGLRLHKEYKVPAIAPKKLGPQLMEPYQVLKPIGRLTYELELLPNMRIQNVVSIAHLESGPRSR